MQFESHLGHRIPPRQELFCFDVLTKLALGASDATGAGFGLAAAEPMQVCGVAGSVSWLVGAPPADIGLCGSSFRFCRVGPGWPTPIHVPGDRRRHDRAVFLQPILPCDRGGP